VKAFALVTFHLEQIHRPVSPGSFDISEALFTSTHMLAWIESLMMGELKPMYYESV